MNVIYQAIHDKSYSFSICCKYIKNQLNTIKGYIIIIMSLPILSTHYAAKNDPQGGVSARGGREDLFLRSLPLFSFLKRSLQVILRGSSKVEQENHNLLVGGSNPSPAIFSLQKRPLQLREYNLLGQKIRYYDWRENIGECIRQFKEFEMCRKVFEFKQGDGRL